MIRDTGFVWVPGHSPEDILDNLVQYEARFESRAIRTAEELASDITEWMKANAPWTDRTGDARRLLHAEAIRSGILGQGRFITITFGHGDISYDIHLETMQAGRFAIVGPALAYWSSQMLERIYIGRDD